MDLIDPRKFVSHIAQVFSAEITAEETNKIITEWEEFSDTVKLSPADLAKVITEYGPNGPEGDSREFLMLLWHTLQGELEDAVAEETSKNTKINKDLQTDEYENWVDERVKVLNKSGFAKMFDTIKNWAGTIAACVGAAVAWTVAAVAIASGVGTAAGIALCVAATALTVMAANMVVSSIAKQCGEELDLFAEVGKGVAKLINAYGGDVDEEKVGMYTSIGINLALAATAAICSFGTTSALSGLTGTAGALTSGMNMVTSGCSIANGIISGASAGINLDLALAQAALLELQALIDKMGDAQEMVEELAARVLSIIFDAMRGNVADSMDLTLESLELNASLNLNKA
ncbi:MAG: hypothetical protein HUK40_14140 [Desulfobacter sp.]|nr:hypothetical protein [Desulfobacter sp.]